MCCLICCENREPKLVPGQERLQNFLYFLILKTKNIIEVLSVLLILLATIILLAFFFI